MPEHQKIHTLFVGESVYKIHTHYKGFASYETAYLGENIDMFAEAVKKEDIDLTFMRNHDVSVKFPLTTEALAEYDVVIISDAPADSFLLHPQTLAGERMPNRFKLINEYVRNGGGFLMIGGWMAFSGFHAKAKYYSTPLTEILPVKMCTWDDRMEIPEGVFPQVLETGHPVLKGIPSEWPFFLGYNKLFHDRGQTLMNINGDPMLVVDTVGKGRVAVFASDCLPHWGPREFCQWQYYPRFWGQLISWLAKRNG
jgi:uncharacterized membrane protein